MNAGHYCKWRCCLKTLMDFLMFKMYSIWIISQYTINHSTKTCLCLAQIHYGNSIITVYILDLFSQKIAYLHHSSMCVRSYPQIEESCSSYFDVCMDLEWHRLLDTSWERLTWSRSISNLRDHLFKTDGELRTVCWQKRTRQSL